MKTVALITNIPAPYRVDLFYYFQTHFPEYSVHVIYTGRGEDNRRWQVDEKKLLNAHFLNARILKIRGALDNRYIHLPGNLGKVLTEISPRAVIAWEYNPAAIQSRIWCRRHRVPFIHLTDGTLHSERNIGSLQTLARKWITGTADACIASSTKAKEKLRFYGVPEEKIFLSLLTQDADTFSAGEKRPVQGRILYVGSMIRRKGLDLLLEALGKTREPWQLHIVGNGTEQEQGALKAQAEALGIGDRICWQGFREGAALAEEYAQAELFVLPTREDCYGLVLLEALLSGTPILSSIYADGAYDIVTPEAGRLVDPYDAQGFALALDQMLKDKPCLESIRQADVSRFSFRETIKGYLDAIAYATEQAGGGRRPEGKTGS